MRKWAFVVFLLSLLTSQVSVAADYPISEIPDSLKKNAGAVIRYERTALNVNDIHKYAYSEEKVISILSNSHEDLAEVRVYYDQKLENIRNFKAWILDASGNVVKHFEKSDAEDYSAIAGFELASSERVKYWDLRKLKVPFTIKYTYEIETFGTFQLPEWLPADRTGVSIEKAQLNVSFAENAQIIFKAIGPVNKSANAPPVKWVVQNFCAIKKLDYAPDILPMLPHVLLMAKEFEIYGHQGSSKSWNDIGLFMNSLMKGRDVLDKSSDPKFDEIIVSSQNQKEKVRAIYSYLQNNYRYVCIALGIGGWQPQDASFTMQKKYGDCKALSTLMKAMLNKAGIESCLTLITAGSDPMEQTADFPNAHFNHAILCVPLPNDTLWLECTSPVAPFNYLGSFTNNRNALMIIDGGARLIRTPVSGQDENLSLSSSRIKLNADISVSITVSFTQIGELQDNLRSQINLKDSKHIESAIYEAAGLKNTTINSYTIKNVESDKPLISFALDLKDEKTIKQTESRLFLKTDIFSPVPSVPEKNETRTEDIVVKQGYTQTDTIILTLPTGYSPENFKADETKEAIDTFGCAKCHIVYLPQTGELQIIRTFSLRRSTYPAGLYQSFRSFLLKAKKQCCPELVLKKAA